MADGIGRKGRYKTMTADPLETRGSYLWDALTNEGGTVQQLVDFARSVRADGYRAGLEDAWKIVREHNHLSEWNRWQDQTCDRIRALHDGSATTSRRTEEPKG